MDQIRSILNSPFSLDRYIGKAVEKCYIASIGDTAVGVACLDRDYAYSLDHIEVAPEVRRVGIGTALINTIRLAIPDDTSIETSLDIKRHGIISFLVSTGFKSYGRTADRIHLRNGWRFRSAPDIMFRITPEIHND
jgi:GNAT superfamily N-acetyltransferase